MGLTLPAQAGFVVEENLDELAELARSTEMEVVGRSLQNRQAPDASTLIGRGKVGEIARAADELGADVVIFDDDLTTESSQETWKSSSTVRSSTAAP